MDPVDSSHEPIPLPAAVLALSRRLAVAAGSFVALISLFHHVPISVASLRGAAAFVAVLFLSKLGSIALEKSLASDQALRRENEETSS